jgi:hypothetical protein
MMREGIGSMEGIRGVVADELLGVAKAPASSGSIKCRRLNRQLQNIEKLAKRDGRRCSGPLMPF